MSLAQQIKDNSFDLFFIQCSFCGQMPESSGELVIGPRVSICKDCITFAAIDQGLIKDESSGSV